MVFAEIGIGVAKVAVCQPLVVSAVKVTSPSLAPVFDQIVPICVPLLPVLFQKRILFIKPSEVDRIYLLNVGVFSLLIKKTGRKFVLAVSF